MLSNKRVVLCVTGGIAAFKSITLVSMLIKKGAKVEVVLTEAALNFVTKKSFEAITHNGIYTDSFESINGEVPHIYLSKADFILIVPATRNEIAKIACGICDNLLTNLVAATKSPVYVAPAMNENMYMDEINLENIEKLRKRGFHIIEPASGYLACGDVGIGRLKEPNEILNEILQSLETPDDFYKDKKVMVTGGPTISKLDPVRIFTNRSSGKMGEALAGELTKRGAKVTYISYIEPKLTNVKYIHIDTTNEMLEAVRENMKTNDILIMSAAPLDYEFSQYFDEKIKKGNVLKFTMRRTPDILNSIKDEKGDLKVIGFAAESENAYEYGKKKLVDKGMDIIFINNIKEQSVFGGDFNSGKILSKNGDELELGIESKEKIAKHILDFAKSHLCM